MQDANHKDCKIYITQSTRIAMSQLRLLWKLPIYLHALIYILAFHYSYITYINPTFEYAHYLYLPFPTAALLFSYLLALLPLAAYRPSVAPAQSLASLIYTLAYIPIQLSLLFTVEITYEKLFLTQSMLTLSMLLFFHIAKGKKKQRQPNVNHYRFYLMDRLVFIAAFISLIALLTANIGHMRLVSFADVYDLRFESAERSKNIISGYLVSWLSYCFTPYLYARGLFYRKWPLLITGLISSFLLYISTGSKSSILLLPVALAVGWLWHSGKNFLPKILFTTSITLALLFLLIPDDGLGIWIKSIIMVRVLATTGWVASKYFEHFSNEGFTYYSHIGPINAIAKIYPYGDLSLGQIIGLTYSGSTEANFNGGFWASDGFAALGSIGILTVTPFVAAVLLTINKTMSNINSKFAVAWMVGFFIAILNTPLSTALLSGGGLIILAQAWWLSRKSHKQKSAQTSTTAP